jgi:hypothetical protein
MSFRRSTVVVALMTAAAIGFTTSPAVAESRSDRSDRTASSSVVRDWERTAMATIYPAVDPTPIPIGVVYLGFTSLAMYDAAQAAERVHGSAPAAVAVAAHDVLAAYFPAAAPALDAALAASLDDLPRRRSTARGIDAGHRIAGKLIRSRADDGRNDTSVVYRQPAEPGFWQPPADGAMLAPWLGYVRPLVVHEPVEWDGPDPITSAGYAADYNEVKLLGSAAGSSRTEEQTATAQFFNSNSAVMVGQGLLAYLDAHPLTLQQTARLFAVMHTSMSDSVITCWRAKLEVGFWRPFQAIHGADADGNDATVADPAWAPLIPNPPYSDYVSGHGCLTAPAVETIRQTLGEDTELTLHSIPLNRDIRYPSLSAIERDAFHARIWGGLHFRDAMEDAYSIGHRTADRALDAFACRRYR